MTLRITRYKSIGSTNSKAKMLAEKGAAEWTVVTTEVQTEGRGRTGRTWESPKGGLWFSLILRPNIAVDRIPLIQFWVANAIRIGIEEICEVKSEVKWPNDMVVDWKKLAGILIETKINGPRLEYAVIGVGLNVNLNDEELPMGATSICLIRKKRFRLQQILSSILTLLEGNYPTLKDEKMVVSEWWDQCAHRMKPVRIETVEGQVRGKCVGVNPDGSIIVQTDQGNLTIPDGTLRLDE